VVEGSRRLTVAGRRDDVRREACCAEGVARTEYRRARNDRPAAGGDSGRGDRDRGNTMSACVDSIRSFRSIRDRRGDELTRRQNLRTSVMALT